MYGMTTEQERAASIARQRRHETDAAVERTGRIASHCADYLASLDGDRDAVKVAVHRDRAAGAHRDYLAARAEQAEAYGGATAGMGARLALAEHDAGERVAARRDLAQLLDVTTYAELVDALRSRGLELK